MIEVTMLIPLADNAGATFSEQHHAAFQAFILDHFEGVTRLAGTSVGQWKDPKTGVIYTDRLVSFLMAVPSLVQLPKIVDIATFAKSHYRQEAIFVRYLGQAEVL